MVGKNYWSHTSPDSKTFNSFIVEAGYGYQTAGENLAYGFGDASQVIKGWMNSPEHRKNILGEKYLDVGFGIASSPNYMDKGPAVLVVAEYGQPAPAAATNVTFRVASPTEGEVKSGTVENSSQNVARIQLLTGDTTSWSLIIISAIMGACLALFIVRHGLRIHRMVSNGEKFIVKHPWMDVGFVFLITAGFVLTRTGGLIH
jgi:hypothetical protein